MALDKLAGPVVLDIPADPASLFIVRALVGKLSEKTGFAPDEANMLVLAIDEACANVIRHAYGGDYHKRIILIFSVNLDYLEVDIRDFGPPADPATFKARDLNDVRPGGLGIHFIRSAVDVVEYAVAPEGGGMVLKLVKFRKQEIAQN